MSRGWWGMACWNGLSAEQQTRLIEHGNLPLDYQPAGTCQQGARVAVETEHDVAPGPRFYCWTCAIEYLMREDTDWATFAGELLDGDVEALRRRLPPHLRGEGVDQG